MSNYETIALRVNVIGGKLWRMDGQDLPSLTNRAGSDADTTFITFRSIFLVLSIPDAIQVVFQVSVILRKSFALIYVDDSVSGKQGGHWAVCSLPRCKAHEEHENSHRGSP